MPIFSPSTVPGATATRLLSSRNRLSRAVAAVCMVWASLSAHATDVTVQPSVGSGFVVKDASGTNERLRVQESGAVSLPGVPAASAQSQGLCIGASGQLGPCSGGTGASYTAATGLALTGTTFSVAPTYRLPQGCAASQIAQWDGTAWTCGSASAAVLPTGTVNQTLRYDASNTLVANNQLQALSDGGLVANWVVGANAGIPATGPGQRLMWYAVRAAFRAGYVEGTQWDDANIGPVSMATGRSTTASGFASTAMGQDTIASGDYSVAMGYRTTARIESSTAMGYNTLADNKYSTAMGIATHASGEASTAMGELTTASEHTATAMGESTTASGKYATSMGYYTVASGPNSTAMGQVTTASGGASTATGNNTTAIGPNSTAMGNSSIASGITSTAIGLVTIADGDQSTALGSHVGTGGHTGSFIYGDNSTRTPIVNSADNQFMVVADGGFVLVSDKSGATGAELKPGTSSWTTLSDRNAKTAVQPVDAGEVLRKVSTLPMNTWQYKTQESKYRHIGPMAQDFYAAFQLGESDKGIDTVDADGVALAAIQGLNLLLTELKSLFTEKDAKISARLDEKDREIASLRAELKTQKAEIAAQKARFAEFESLASDLAEMRAQVGLHKPSALAMAGQPQTP